MWSSFSWSHWQVLRLSKCSSLMTVIGAFITLFSTTGQTIDQEDRQGHAHHHILSMKVILGPRTQNPQNNPSRVT